MSKRDSGSRQAISWSGLALQCDHGLEELHQLFQNAFAEGIAKPTGMELKRVLLFEQFFNMLSLPEFTSLTQLDKYYTEFSESCPQHIEIFCQALEIPPDDISENKKTMLHAIVQLYHQISRLRFLVSSFGNHSQSAIFNDAISQIEQARDACQESLMRINFYQINEAFTSLEASLDMAAALLNANRYPESAIPVRQAVSGDALEIGARALGFHTLPMTNVLNEHTGNLHYAEYSGDKTAAARLREELLSHQLQIASVRGDFHHFVMTRIGQVERMLAEIERVRQILMNRISDLAFNPDMEAVLVLLQEISGNSNGKNTCSQLRCKAEYAAQCCQKQSVIENATLGIWSKGWKTAASRLSEICGDLAGQAEAAANKYAFSHLSVATVCDLKNSMEHSLSELEDFHEASKRRLETVLRLGRECEEAMTRVESILTGHLQAHDESMMRFLTTFMGRHWWKLAIGGAGGSGAGTTAALLLALDPTKIAILVIGTTVACASLGAGMGAAQDALHRRKETGDHSSESRLSGRHFRIFTASQEDLPVSHVSNKPDNKHMLN